MPVLLGHLYVYNELKYDKMNMHRDGRLNEGIAGQTASCAGWDRCGLGPVPDFWTATPPSVYRRQTSHDGITYVESHTLLLVFIHHADSKHLAR